MRTYRKYLAWLAVVAFLFGPLTGLCTMQAWASAATAHGCPTAGAEDASCCCGDPCESHSGMEDPSPSDHCRQVQSLDDHWTPGPRVTVDRILLPTLQWATLSVAFQPETVRRAQAPWPVTYRPSVPVEAKSSLLAQGCALNT